jgi:hypothetical protein
MTEITPLTSVSEMAKVLCGRSHAAAPGFTDGQQCTTLVTGMVVDRNFVVLIRPGPG